MKSLVLITQDRATGNLVATALGHQDLGAQTYVVPLSASGLEPVTHWGCHTWATDAFVQAISACVTQTALPPAPWAAVGLDEAAVFAFCGALIFSVQDAGEPLEHFNGVLAANVLQKIPEAAL
jgi:hypothetical protein